MRTIDAVLFDKTGTLTKGEPALHAAATAGLPEDEVIALAAAAETDSEHPLARAIVAAAATRSLDVPRAEDFRASTAVGVSATVAGRRVAVGGPNLLAEHGLAPLPETGPWSGRGQIVLHVLVDGEIAGALGLADEVRQESREAVDALHALGIRVVMITGDAAPVAEAVAAELGIDQVFAGVRPEDKSGKVAALQEAGRTVAMVGDGVNDAPALAQADVGIAMGTGTDVAMESADITLVKGDLIGIAHAKALSVLVMRNIVENLFFAFAYNVIGIPIAALGLLTPIFAGLAMALSSVSVLGNALRVKGAKIR